MQSNSSRYYILVFLALLCLPTSPLVKGAAARTRSGKNGTPKSMGRAADIDMSYDGNAGILRTAEYTSGETALSMIQFPWQQLGYNVSFLGRRPGYRALTLVDEHRIEVYIKGEEKPNSVAFDLAHEFGHVVDLKFNNPERRRHWLEMRGINPDTPWFGASACSDYDTPAGDFAETFAYLLLGPGSYHSRMAPPPRPDQIRELAEFCHIEHISSSLLAPSTVVQVAH